MCVFVCICMVQCVDGWIIHIFHIIHGDVIDQSINAMMDEVGRKQAATTNIHKTMIDMYVLIV